MNEPLIEVKNLYKSYGDVHAVRGIDLKIYQGSCIGLLGPNGAGKSTTLEVIEGIKKETSGEVLFRGEKRTRRFFDNIGIQFQSTALQDFMKVKEALATFASFYKKTIDFSHLIELCQIGDFLERDHRHLSGGQKQRLLLAIALINDPEVIFLDEPTTGLDPQSRVNFWDLIRNIKKQGKTVVLTTHYMDEAYQLCDQIVIVDQGKVIAEGTPDQLLSSHFKGKKVILSESLKEKLPIEFPWKLFEAHRRWQFFAEDIERVFQYFVEKQISLDELEIHSPTLEDLFIQLTGEELRES